MQYRRGWGQLEHEIHLSGIPTTIKACEDGVIHWLPRGAGEWDSGSKYELTEQTLYWLFDNVGQEDKDWNLVRGDTFNLYLAFPTMAQALLFKLTFA